MAEIKIILDGVDNASRVLNGALSTIGGVAAGTAAAGFAALATGIGLSLSEAIDAQKVMAQTEAAIKSTGGAAGMSADQISALAGSLSEASTYSDDAIQQGENLLLTFTNIGKDVFPTATQAMVDMAAAMGTDVKGGAIQLGKALNDPIAGISALSRVGVTFSDAQKDVIKKLMETGDVAGAQKVILAELAKEFGGSAAAQAETFGGKMEVLKNQLLNVAEGVGTALLPVLTQLFDGIVTPALPVIQAFADVFATQLTSAIQLAGLAFDTLVKNGGSLQPIFAALNVLVPGFRDNFGGLAGAVVNVQDAFVNSLPMIQATFANLVAFIQTQMATFAPTLIANVTSMLNSIATFWTAHGDQVMAVVGGALAFIGTIFGETLTLISGLVATTLALINGDWDGAKTAWTNTLVTFWNGALALVGTNLTEFITVWQTNFAMLITICQVVFADALTAIQTALATIGGAVSQGILDAIAGAQTVAAGFVSIGTAMMDGLKQGVVNAAQGVIDAAKGAVSDAVNAAKNLLGIHSPSTVFAGIGGNMMLGMAEGIRGQGNAPAAATSSVVTNITNTYALNVNSSGVTNVGNEFGRGRALMGALS